MLGNGYDVTSLNESVNGHAGTTLDRMLTREVRFVVLQAQEREDGFISFPLDIFFESRFCNGSLSCWYFLSFSLKLLLLSSATTMLSPLLPTTLIHVEEWQKNAEFAGLVSKLQTIPTVSNEKKPLILWETMKLRGWRLTFNEVVLTRQDVGLACLNKILHESEESTQKQDSPRKDTTALRTRSIGTTPTKEYQLPSFIATPPAGAARPLKKRPIPASRFNKRKVAGDIDDAPVTAKKKHKAQQNSGTITKKVSPPVAKMTSPAFAEQGISVVTKKGSSEIMKKALPAAANTKVSPNRNDTAVASPPVKNKTVGPVRKRKVDLVASTSKKPRPDKKKYRQTTTKSAFQILPGVSESDIRIQVLYNALKDGGMEDVQERYGSPLTPCKVKAVLYFVMENDETETDSRVAPVSPEKVKPVISPQQSPKKMKISEQEDHIMMALSRQQTPIKMTFLEQKNHCMTAVSEHQAPVKAEVSQQKAPSQTTVSERRIPSEITVSQQPLSLKMTAWTPMVDDAVAPPKANQSVGANRIVNPIEGGFSPQDVIISQHDWPGSKLYLQFVRNYHELLKQHPIYLTRGVSAPQLVKQWKENHPGCKFISASGKVLDFVDAVSWTDMLLRPTYPDERQSLLKKLYHESRNKCRK
jgi:hypothetical protein